MKILKHDRFNGNFVHEAKKMGGKWNPSACQWELPDIAADLADDAINRWSSPQVPVEITAKINLYGSESTPITFCGYTIARAFSRDGGAKMGDGVVVVSGIAYSGGSRKNYCSKIDAGTVFRIAVPELVLEKYQKIEEKTDWSVRRLDAKQAEKTAVEFPAVRQLVVGEK